MILSTWISLLLLCSVNALAPTRPTQTIPLQNNRRQATLPQLPGGAQTAVPTGTNPVTTSRARTSVISIPANAPAGGLSFTAPAITAAPSYYKLAANNPITFGWNFTSLIQSPASLTFSAYCSFNSKTYAVGPATGIPGSQTQLVWDPSVTSPGAPAYVQASYTLRVFDERGPTALPIPGRFWGGNAIVIFAMYSPAAYTPLASGWTCAGCSAAVSLRSALSSPLAIGLPVTVALILIGGAGVLR